MAKIHSKISIKMKKIILLVLLALSTAAASEVEARRWAFVCESSLGTCLLERPYPDQVTRNNLDHYRLLINMDPELNGPFDPGDEIVLCRGAAAGSSCQVYELAQNNVWIAGSGPSSNGYVGGGGFSGPIFYPVIVRWAGYGSSCSMAGQELQCGVDNYVR